MIFSAPASAGEVAAQRRKGARQARGEWTGAQRKLNKTGPTTYEFTAERFTPARDIHMLILE